MSLRKVRVGATLADPVTAPVTQGQRLGSMVLRSGDGLLAEIPLVAAEPVQRLTLWQIWKIVLQKAAMAADNAELRITNYEL